MHPLIMFYFCFSFFLYLHFLFLLAKIIACYSGFTVFTFVSEHFTFPNIYNSCYLETYPEFLSRDIYITWVLHLLLCHFIISVIGCTPDSCLTSWSCLLVSPCLVQTLYDWWNLIYDDSICLKSYFPDAHDSDPYNKGGLPSFYKTLLSIHHNFLL